MVAGVRAGAAKQLTKILDGMPPEAPEVLKLQLKPKWSEADHARLSELTRAWTDVHKQVFEARFDLGYRPMRWQ
jgi:hypothetical protein